MVVEWSERRFGTFSSGSSKKPRRPRTKGWHLPDHVRLFRRLGSASSFDVEPLWFETEIAVSCSEPGFIADEALQRLNGFLDLRPDWDSYGGRSIAPGAISTARRLLLALQSEFSTVLGDRLKPYDVAPIATGGVQLEWRSGARAIEVEITPESELKCLTVERFDGEAIYKQSQNASTGEVLAQLERVLSA